MTNLVAVMCGHSNAVKYVQDITSVIVPMRAKVKRRSDEKHVGDEEVMATEALRPLQGVAMIRHTTMLYDPDFSFGQRQFPC